MFDESTELHVRLDKWLWAARVFKTRSLAATAVAGGKVQVNCVRAKPARSVRVGDRLEIRRGPFQWCVVVRALEKQRRPAVEAALLYEETEESARRREEIAGQLRAQEMQHGHFRSRPTKKDRRAILHLTRDEF